MEKITVDQSIRNNRIEETAKDCLECIQGNALLGVHTTDLFIDKEIAGDVKEEIVRQLNESKTTYEFLIVARGFNQYTGKPQSYTSETIGTEKHYKIRIS